LGHLAAAAAKVLAAAAGPAPTMPPPHGRRASKRATNTRQRSPEAMRHEICALVVLSYQLITNTKLGVANGLFADWTGFPDRSAISERAAIEKNIKEAHPKGLTQKKNQKKKKKKKNNFYGNILFVKIRAGKIVGTNNVCFRFFHSFLFLLLKVIYKIHPTEYIEQIIYLFVW